MIGFSRDEHAELLRELPRALLGCRPAEVRSLVDELADQARSLDRQRDELERRELRVVGELDRLNIEIEELSGVIELSRQVASSIAAEARERYERTIELARLEATRIAEEQSSPEVAELEREVAELQATLDARRARFKETLRASLDDLVELEA
jgi:hypothetical protein